jgi:multisubunit Na+/H+ antiporter MnhB subunit
MMLDNLFPMLGGTGTAVFLMGILAPIGAVTANAVFCPRLPMRRRLGR